MRYCTSSNAKPPVLPETGVLLTPCVRPSGSTATRSRTRRQVRSGNGYDDRKEAEMTKRPELKTDRLLLRPFTLADAPVVQRLAGDRDIAVNTLTMPHPYEDGMAEEWIGTLIIGSFDFNTECIGAERYDAGIKTSHPDLIKSAVNFFEGIWGESIPLLERYREEIKKVGL